jgi:broad specificity phosphatase PhoE
MSIYFVRHGQTDANIKMMMSNDLIGEDDDQLNENGEKQVIEISDKLKNVHFDVILSSPYKRALQTAKIIAKNHKMPIIIDNNLRERDGGGINEKTWHESFNFDKNVLFDGETVSDFFERVYFAIDGIKEKYGNKNVLVVSHGGVHHGFYAYFNNLPWRGNLRIDRIHNADFRKYDFKENK